MKYISLQYYEINMIIYLDESKRLAEWKMVIAWFITKHNTNYINRFIENKKRVYWFIDVSIELKGIKNSWQFFYENMIKDLNFGIISNNIVWITIDWYYRDNKNLYMKALGFLISKIYNALINYNKDITIIADNLILWKNTRKVELEIQGYLNINFPLQSKHKFNFVNSKSFWWVQLSDLISYQFRLVNLNQKKDFDDFISNNSFNINLKEIIKI